MTSLSKQKAPPKSTVFLFFKQHKALKFALLWTALYLALGLTMVFFHEIWGDEGQAWLIARDLPVAGIIAQMSYEGSPAMWHLLLAPLAQVGLPVQAMQVLNVLILSAAVFVFSFKAPFPRWATSLFLLSNYFFFEYLVIARSYSLTVLFLFLALVIYAARNKKSVLFAIVLVLLTNTTLMGAIFAGAFTLLWLVEIWKQGDIRNKGVPLLIIGLGFFIFLIQFYPAPDMINLIIFPKLSTGLWALSETIFGSELFNAHIKFKVVFSIPLIALVMVSLFRKPRAAAYFLLTIVPLIVFIGMKGLTQRHEGMLFAAMVASLWIYQADKLEWKRPEPSPKFETYLLGPKGYRLALGIIGLSCIISIPKTIENFYYGFTVEWSQSKKGAAIIQEQYMDQEIVAIGQGSNAILAYVPGKVFYYIPEHKYATYNTWVEQYDVFLDTPKTERIQLVLEEFPEKTPLVLASRPQEYANELCFRRIQGESGFLYGYGGEFFFLYERIPNCEPDINVL